MKIRSLLPVLAAVIFLAIISCNQAAMKSGDDMLAKNKAVVEKLNAAFDSGDTTAIDSLLSADAVDHTPAPGMTGSTREQLKKIIAGFHSAFPDGKSTMVAMVAEDDWVSSYGTYSGTNSGSFMGMPASNKKITFDFSDVFKVKDGKITDHWGVIDMMTMMQQMGMMPQQSMSNDSSMKKMDMPKQ